MIRKMTLYLRNRLFIALLFCGFLSLVSFFYPPLTLLSFLTNYLVIALLLTDLLLLYKFGGELTAQRIHAERLSNGDRNPVQLVIENRYPYKLKVEIVDELPAQFQIRDFSYTLQLLPGDRRIVHYQLRPVERGEYRFGDVNLYACTSIGLAMRRHRIDLSEVVPVYPSYIQMRRYELLAISHRLAEAGIKKIRRVGHTMEFDQIREYVQGDDYRKINWKATARRSDFMVNQYQDEKAQQVYSVINMGRVMKMPFEGMTLLDYAINASLVISNIAIRKQDKAGLITFSDKMGAILPAERRQTQMSKILELLYNQQTRFLESDYRTLYANIRNRLPHRSLLLLFTNFESLSGLRRQITFLRALARRHLLVVIFFENTELKAILETDSNSTKDIYERTIAEQFVFEKRQIVKELEQYAIQSILTTPAKLSVNTINKYLTMKARGLI